MVEILSHEMHTRREGQFKDIDLIMVACFEPAMKSITKFVLVYIRQDMQSVSENSCSDLTSKE